MGRIFGTDGVRGVAGVELTAQLALDLAVAAVPVLAPVATVSGHRRRPVAVIGRDSRASGDFLEAAVVAGLASSGVDVLRLGVIPTPGVAYLTGALDADFGVVLSASHNPAADNGIKFFGKAGVKLPDETEDAIEARLRAIGDGTLSRNSTDGLCPLGFGRVTDAYSAHETYLDHLLGSLPAPVTGQLPLHGMRVVVDCAHGAAYSIGPRALRRAGAEVIFLPSAFTAQTGKDHWEVLIRARAIETQCWMVAPATWGKHTERTGDRFTYGHSLVCDPWGHVVAKVSDGVGWATARIDSAVTARVRRDMPVLDHRKLA